MLAAPARERTPCAVLDACRGSQHGRHPVASTVRGCQPEPARVMPRGGFVRGTPVCIGPKGLERTIRVYQNEQITRRMPGHQIQ
jgi:hypothetical protein